MLKLKVSLWKALSVCAISWAKGSGEDKKSSRCSGGGRRLDGGGSVALNAAKH